MNSADEEKACEQSVKKAFRLMVAALVVVTVAVEVLCASRAGMSLSACLVSLELGVLLGAGLEALCGRWRRHVDR